MHIIVKQYPHYLAELEFLEPPLELKPLYVAFSKNTELYEKKLKDFNAGLKQLQEDGTLQRIMEKHGF